MWLTAAPGRFFVPDGGQARWRKEVLDLPPTSPASVIHHVYLERRCPNPTCGQRVLPPHATAAELGVPQPLPLLGRELLARLAQPRPARRLPYPAPASDRLSASLNSYLGSSHLKPFAKEGYSVSGTSSSRIVQGAVFLKDYVIGRVEDFPEGSTVAVAAGTKTVAIFNAGGDFFAIHNRCSHKGASLCDGLLDQQRRVIRCPWHLWDWSLETGRLECYPKKRMPLLNVRVDEGEVILRA